MAGECVAGPSIKCACHNKRTMKDMICPWFTSPDVVLMDRFHRCQIKLWIPLSIPSLLNTPAIVCSVSLIFLVCEEQGALALTCLSKQSMNVLIAEGLYGI